MSGPSRIHWVAEHPNLTAAPPVPAAGHARVPYFRNGAWYWMDDTGAERLIAPLHQRLLAKGAIPAQDVNDTGPITFTDARSDVGWTIAGNAMTFTGTPDFVEISVQVDQAIADAVNLQRPSPILELRRGGTIIATSRTGYIRDATDHEESSNTIAIVDHDPGANPSYTLTSRQETTQGGVVTCTANSQFSAIANVSN